MNGNLCLVDMGFKEEVGGYDVIVVGFQGKCQWIDGKLNGDVMEILFNISFDLDGLCQFQVFVIEGDVFNGIVMLFGSFFIQCFQFFSDVCIYWSLEVVCCVIGYELIGCVVGGFVDFRNFGVSIFNVIECEVEVDGIFVIKYWWDFIEDDIQVDFVVMIFYLVIQEYFLGGGFLIYFMMVGDMMVIVVCMNMVVGVGLILQIVEGWMFLDEGIDIIVEWVDLMWLIMFFVLCIFLSGVFSSVYDWMDKWGVNYILMGYSYIGVDVFILVVMLCILVLMYNIEIKDIFCLCIWFLLELLLNCCVRDID